MPYQSGIPRRRNRRVHARGFTLVELMVAVMVMTVGILGLASTAAVVMRMMHGGVRQTLAANVVAARFETRRKKRCDSLSSGSSSTRGIAEDWTVSSGGTATGRRPRPLQRDQFRHLEHAGVPELHPMHHTVTRRRAFTLVELLIVVSVLGIVMVALTKVIVGQQRFYRGASEMIETQDKVRDASDDRWDAFTLGAAPAASATCPTTRGRRRPSAVSWPPD